TSLGRLASVGRGERLAAEYGGSEPLEQACRMIAGWLGIEPPQVGRPQGPALSQLQAALARTTGMRMGGGLLEGGWYANDGGPLLGFVMEENDVLSPVALLPSRRGYKVHNPKNNAAVPVTREVVNGLHPQAYQFYPPFPNKPLAPFDVLRFSSKRSVRD